MGYIELCEMPAALVVAGHYFSFACSFVVFLNFLFKFMLSLSALARGLGSVYSRFERIVVLQIIITNFPPSLR